MMRPRFVLILGSSGSGKTRFLNQVAGANFAEGSGLDPCTRTIQTKVISIDGLPVMLADTPALDLVGCGGHDDSMRTITDYLRKLSDENIIRDIAGIVYMHKISDRRMNAEVAACYARLRELCGQDAVANVAIVTSMWDLVREEVGVQREKELRMAAKQGFVTYKSALDRGATMARFRNTSHSAKEILRILISKPRTVLPCQQPSPNTTTTTRDPVSQAPPPGRHHLKDQAIFGGKPSLEPTKTKVILVMGPSGTGKTRLVNLASKSTLQEGSGLEPCTSRPQSINILLDNQPVLLVDTPALDFDEADAAIEEIAQYLDDMPKEEFAIVGIVYIHDLRKPRFDATARRCYGGLLELCGDHAMKNVAIVASMGDSDTKKIGQAKLKALASTQSPYYKDALHRGASLHEHRNTAASALTILRSLVNKPPVALQCQVQADSDLVRLGTYVYVESVHSFDSGCSQ